LRSYIFVENYKFIVTAHVRGTETELHRSWLHWVRLHLCSHIPAKVYDEFQEGGKPDPSGKIPGYAGYVKSIKPENLYSNTFGKTTLDVEKDTYVRGQDF
jgi:hypothetical protein